ncbi:FixH family protein [Rhodovulum sp. DZ06]|uniref:FixH family protein n=1 Tax=Rhodovulum sp. DZ06 TaxID=3425126 RepID=UPI003D3583DB
MTERSESAPAGGRPLTGKHVLLIAVAFFGVIISVNVYMMTQAIGGFPGLVVKNSYVASQSWDKDRQAQLALGWDVAVSTAGHALHASFTDAEGRPLRGLDVQAVVGRPATLAEDREVALLPDPAQPGVYVMKTPLDDGMWRVEITAADGAGGRHHVVTEFEIR